MRGRVQPRMNGLGFAAALALALGGCAGAAVEPAPSPAGVDAGRLAELYRRQDCFGLRDALAGAQGGAVVGFYRAAVALVAAEHAGERLHFGFDTGAQSTALYPPFHAARREVVEAGGEPSTVQVGGAGGMRQVRAYTLAPLVLRIGGREATLPQVRVYAEPTSDDSDRVYGNIGQDVMRQFEAMTVDFHRMQLRFR